MGYNIYMLQEHLNEIKELYYQQNKTLQEIGKRYGVSRERVRQVMEESGLYRDTKRSGKFRYLLSLSEYFDLVKQTNKERMPNLLRLISKETCQGKGCRRKKLLHIHHLKYPAISLADIEILCPSCHRAKHQKGNNIRIQKEICDRYSKGEKAYSLAKEYHIAPQGIYLFLQKWDVPRRKKTNLVKGQNVGL